MDIFEVVLLSLTNCCCFHWLMRRIGWQRMWHHHYLLDLMTGKGLLLQEMI